MLCFVPNMDRGDVAFQGCQADVSCSLHANRQTRNEVSTRGAGCLPWWDDACLLSRLLWPKCYWVTCPEYNCLPPSSMSLFLHSGLLSKHFHLHQLLILSWEEQNPNAFLVWKRGSSYNNPFWGHVERVSSSLTPYLLPKGNVIVMLQSSCFWHALFFFPLTYWRLGPHCSVQNTNS